MSAEKQVGENKQGKSDTKVVVTDLYAKHIKIQPRKVTGLFSRLRNS